MWLDTTSYMCLIWFLKRASGSWSTDWSLHSPFRLPISWLMSKIFGCVCILNIAITMIIMIPSTLELRKAWAHLCKRSTKPTILWLCSMTKSYIWKRTMRRFKSMERLSNWMSHLSKFPKDGEAIWTEFILFVQFCLTNLILNYYHYYCWVSHILKNKVIKVK